MEANRKACQRLRAGRVNWEGEHSGVDLPNLEAGRRQGQVLLAPARFEARQVRCAR